MMVEKKRKNRLFGPDTELSPLGKMIVDGDIAGLKASLGKDWQLNERISIARHTHELALSVALVENRLDVIDFLLTSGADLNVSGSPAISFAAGYSSEDTIDKLLNAGARIDAVNNVGSNALSRALYADRVDLLPFLVERGLSVDADGGNAFRQAVLGRKYSAVRFFLAQGIDPNVCRPNSVFPNSPTALAVAVVRGDIEMVKLLLAHGADATIADSNGRRPYHVAVINRHEELRDYLRSLEPQEWHVVDKKVEWLRSKRVPVALIKFLKSASRKIHIQSGGCSWIELHELTDVHEMTWEGKDYLVLMSGFDDLCACGLLVWSIKSKKLCLIDEEHDLLTPLGSWARFIDDPDSYLDRQYK